MRRLRRAIRRAIGWRRLAHGFCPSCNSSPPRGDCRVCQGSYLYGPRLSTVRLLVWTKRWEELS